MNKNTLIHCSEYLPMYHKLPVNQKGLAAGICGYKSCSNFVKSKYLTRHYFNKFTEFYERISKDKISPNFVGKKSEFDLEHLKHYYKELNNWIDSDEYLSVSKTTKNKVVAEQIRISKIINNQNK